MIVAARTPSLMLSPLATSYAGILNSHSISECQDVLASTSICQPRAHHVPQFQASLQMTQDIPRVRVSTPLLPHLCL